MANRTQNQKVDRLLTPSWLSGLVAVICGLALTIGVILVFSFNTSQVQQQLISLQSTSAPALTLPGQTAPGDNTSSLQNTWPLLGFWAVVGLITYFVVETIAKFLRNATELRHELDYVHARRESLIKDAVTTLAVRLLAVIVWLVFIQIFLKRIIPYSITAAHASASDLKSLPASLYALLAFIMIAFSMHAHTLFLRVILRRPRVFSTD